MQVWSMDWIPGDWIPREDEMATHSSILAWRIPWTEEPGGLQTMGSQRVGHNWAHMHTCRKTTLVRGFLGKFGHHLTDLCWEIKMINRKYFKHIKEPPTVSIKQGILLLILNNFKLYSPGNSPGWTTGVGSLSLLQRNFPTQGSNPGLPCCRQILNQLSQKGSPRILEWVAYPFSRGSSWPRNWTGVSCLAGGFFTS